MATLNFPEVFSRFGVPTINFDAVGCRPSVVQGSYQGYEIQEDLDLVCGEHSGGILVFCALDLIYVFALRISSRVLHSKCLQSAVLSLLPAVLLSLHRQAVGLGMRLSLHRREVVLLSLHRWPAAMLNLLPPVIPIRRLNRTLLLSGLECVASADFRTESYTRRQQRNKKKQTCGRTCTFRRAMECQMKSGTDCAATGTCK